MRLALLVILWNAAFAAVLAAVIVNVAATTGDAIGLALPWLLGLWLLALGARFASHRGVALAIAVLAGLLLLLQCAVYLFLIWFARGFHNLGQAAGFEFGLFAVVVTGVPLLWWYRRAKLPRVTRPA